MAVSLKPFWDEHVEPEVFARCRVENGKTDAVNRLVAQGKDYEMERAGVAGEFGFCLVTDQPLTKLFLGAGGIDPGYDIEINGVKIDVKCSPHPRSRYLIVTEMNPIVDVYVGARADLEQKTVEFFGWITAGEFTLAQDPFPHGSGDPSVLFKQLHPFNEAPWL